MRLSSFLLLITLSPAQQLPDLEARFFRLMLANERARVPARTLRFALLTDSSADASSLIARRLRAQGLPMVSLATRPGPDTLIIRITPPVFDSAGAYRFGIESLECRAGRVQGGRSVATVRCSPTACREWTETPLDEDGRDYGPCGAVR